MTEMMWQFLRTPGILEGQIMKKLFLIINDIDYFSAMLMFGIFSQKKKRLEMNRGFFILSNKEE